MPGILPMKVIKVGSSSQSRIAQACDRCRSKKIRCDGIRPSCTQCINIGFECNTSDKLSRRAFPRGYTESLEERVRSLESEVRELKDLLDEKDEKIDILLRVRSNSPRTTDTTPTTTATGTGSPKAVEADKDDTFTTVNSPVFIQNEEAESYVSGSSSGRAFAEAFKSRIKGNQDVAVDETVDKLLTQEHAKKRRTASGKLRQRPPPRLLSDRLVNIFLQEWAPMFPILHRPTFLRAYEDYVAMPETTTDGKALAQLFLVFSIAIQSTPHPDRHEMRSIEQQWRAAIDAVAIIESISSLQNLLLAQISCLLSGDFSGLLRFKGLAVSLAHRMGLHRSQKDVPCDTLVRETRKKVFWSLYTLDCFSAAQLGLPRQLRDTDAMCEYPVDIDDEYISESGFLTAPPGESTKLSSGIALFRASGILANVLEQLYSVSGSHSTSFKSITTLNDELDSWQQALPQHLRLQFVQDKPSTNIINSTSPLLSLAHQYICSLIHRPAVCAAGSLGDRADSSIAAVATAAKRTVHILELLDERNLSFAFCLNRNELIITSGFGLLFEGLQFTEGGNLNESTHAVLDTITKLLSQNKSSDDARNFHDLAHAVLPCSRPSCSPPPQRSNTSSESSSEEAAANVASSGPDIVGPPASLYRSDSANTTSGDIGVSTHPKPTPNLDFLSFNDPPYALSADASPIMHPGTQQFARSFGSMTQADARRMSYPIDPNWERLLSGFNGSDPSALSPVNDDDDRMDMSSLALATPLQPPAPHSFRRPSAPDAHSSLAWDTHVCGPSPSSDSLGSSMGGAAVPLGPPPRRPSLQQHTSSNSSLASRRGAGSPSVKGPGPGGGSGMKESGNSVRWRARMGSLDRTDGSAAAAAAVFRRGSVTRVGEEDEPLEKEDEDMSVLDDGFGL